MKRRLDDLLHPERSTKYGEHALLECHCAVYKEQKLGLALTSHDKGVPKPALFLEYRLLNDSGFCVDDKTFETSQGPVMFPGRRNYGEWYFCGQKQKWQTQIEEYVSVRGVARIILAYAPWTGPLYLGWLSYPDFRYGPKKPVSLSLYTDLYLTEDAAFHELKEHHDRHSIYSNEHEFCNCLWAILALEVPSIVAAGERGQSCIPDFARVEEKPQVDTKK